MIRHIANWPSYLLFKSGNNKGAFTFRLRNGKSITVQKQMFPPFKEIFFDRVYLKNLPARLRDMQDPVVIDIGANVGFFSLFALLQFPKAQIFSFEPMPFNYRVLQDYHEGVKEPRWKIYNEAIAADESGLTLHYMNEDAFSTMASVFHQRNEQNSIKVPTQSLSGFIKSQGLDRVDFLKMDCEGSEYGIFYATEPEDFKRIHFMSIETHRGNEPEHQHAALVDFLRKQGYQLQEEDYGKVGYIWAHR